MIAPDSSVIVAGFVPSHRFHEAAVPALVEVKERGSLIAHTVAEAYSVLSAPGGIYRAESRAVVSYLDQFLADRPPILVPAAAYREALETLVAANRAGGAIYDALIALAAREAKATLATLDARAAPIYELCRADVRFLASG